MILLMGAITSLSLSLFLRGFQGLSLVGRFFLYAISAGTLSSRNADRFAPRLRFRVDRLRKRTVSWSARCVGHW